MKNKRKLLFIVEAMGGGVFTYIVELTKKLVIDYDVYVAYGVRKQTPLDYETYFDNRIHLIKVETFVRAINPIKDFQSYLFIKKLRNEINPDIIHLHSSKAGVLGRIAFFKESIPVFYTPHGYSFLMESNSSLKNCFYKLLERICSKGSCITISCSKGEHLETLELTNNAKYVSNGIDLEDLDKYLYLNKKNGTGNNLKICTVGRICEQKNPELFNLIASEFPCLNFIWIGDGELKNDLKSENIKITGWLSREDALEEMCKSDIFILTSKWEGLPMSLLEAMYLEKTCIVSNVIGNRDVINNGVNGFLCSSKEEFIDAIKYCENKDTSNIVAKARESILKEYNTDVMAERYKNIYEGEL